MAIPNKFGENDQKDRPDAGIKNEGLTSWVIARVRRGREVRDSIYGKRWKEYTRLWRGLWDPEDKNYDSERSRLISPALQQAIEMTVAEIEEAIFSRRAWFDIDDDIADEESTDVIRIRDQLLEDFELAEVPSGISQTVLNGAIYGTGIAKINVSTKQIPDGQGNLRRRVVVSLDPIRPDEFIIDPSARTIEEAGFVAHEMVKPIHSIKEKQASGAYRPGDVGSWSGDTPHDPTGTGVTSAGMDLRNEGALITEYYGKVPARYLPGAENVGGMVEAIVTIANETTLLKAIPSPFTYKDRPVIAYQHDTVPGEFWGRGVAEKGYNAQKALDSELRARIDALALITSPMLGADITRMPRNPDMRVRPGKTFFTRGRPTEVIESVGFAPQGLALTFQQSGDLERMVQMATGAMDSASPLSTNRRNETASGMSMLQSGFIKRSKRTMQNLERQFLDKLVRKSVWRYVQFDPERYPQEMKFVVHSTMGIMAKEVENNQLVQMLGFVPPESPAHMIVLQALFENSVSAEKESLHRAIREMAKPPSPEQQQQQQMMQELQMRANMAEVAKTEAEAANEQAQAALTEAKRVRELILAELEDDKVEIQAANAATGAAKVQGDGERILNERERNRIEELKARAAATKATQGNSNNT